MTIDAGQLTFLCGLLAALSLTCLMIVVRQWVALRRVREEIAVSATRQYEHWRGRDLDVARSELARQASEEARLEMERWKQQHEIAIRQDAINRSGAVVLGKVAEHMAPYLPGFPFNPRDARFLGSPIDFVVFDGADEGEVREVVFVEVKTNTSSLTGKQRMIRDAILEGRVSWMEFRV